MILSLREALALLQAWRAGDQTALEKLTPLIYNDLRRLASRFIRRERIDHTLQPTALVHETYLRLADKGQPLWQDRAHFYAVAALLMRRILVDHARVHRSARRGFGLPKLSLDEPATLKRERVVADIVSLDESLKVFEEGVGLARHCAKYLADAERRIELLAKDETGALSQKPFAFSADEEP